MQILRSRACSILAILGLVVTAGAGCGGGTGNGPGEIPKSKAPLGKEDSSVEAVFLDFEFEAELIASYSWNPQNQIESQLLYTVGQLNGDRSVSRLDHVELTDVRTSSEDGGTLIQYRARMLVAWGKKDDVPSRYTFMLPRDVTYAGQDTFTGKYSHDCVDWSAHDVDAGSMWYYYRPGSYRCELDPADIVEAEAVVTVSEVNTTGKYPEYHKVWEDDELRVLAIFGKYEDGATADSDAGIAAYNQFVRRIGERLGGYDLVTSPADYPSNPGVDVPDIVFKATLDDDRSIEVTCLLVDNVRTAGREFDQRYEALSGSADLIAYNGHSGLGANIRALASKGRWETGQYAIVFMNGCDTYAYVDSALLDAHAEVNPDDAVGTLYVDMVMNAMPAYFRSDASATMALVNGLLSYKDPQTYENIFTRIDTSQVVLVSGEQDNVYHPGYDPDDPDPDDPVSWEGMDESGTVAADEELRFPTPTLEPGAYLFEMRGSGDADLYVRVGTEPSARSYDCRPFLTGSEESCRVELTTPAAIHVMVRGWDASSDFHLTGRPD